jgi:uncharacterized protein (TIGR02271 family)
VSKYVVALGEETKRPREGGTLDMEREERTDKFSGVENRFAGYEVYDNRGEKIGKVDDLFVNEADQPEYIGVKMGFLGTKSTLIPWEMVRIDEATERMTVSTDKDMLKGGPAFDDYQEITPESEMRVHSYYGLRRATAGTGERGAYRANYSSSDVEEERAGATTDEDELRVRRIEEELWAGTRERQAGAVRVRKRVRTDREQVEVPKKREEVTVERVPVEGEAAATAKAKIGDQEIRVPVTEEEVVVEKRPVVKEEIRIRKEVVEDTEVVEEAVRREEIDVEDETTTRRTDH